MTSCEPSAIDGVGVSACPELVVTPRLAAMRVMSQMSICCVILAKPTLMDMAVFCMTLWVPPSEAL